MDGVCLQSIRPKRTSRLDINPTSFDRSSSKPRLFFGCMHSVETLYIWVIKIGLFDSLQEFIINVSAIQLDEVYDRAGNQ